MSGNVRCVPRFASTNGRQQGNGRYHLERSAANLASSSSLSRSRPSSECRGSKPSIYAPIDPCRRAISIKRLAFSTHARNLRSLREPTVSPRWRGIRGDSRTAESRANWPRRSPVLHSKQGGYLGSHLAELAHHPYREPLRFQSANSSAARSAGPSGDSRCSVSPDVGRRMWRYSPSAGSRWMLN
ncbi:MAG: hypothetical protein H6R11_1669 [Proteobacteria bacterium]|nr:hypothetical protein [Pseudomonadota bacterium]